MTTSVAEREDLRSAEIRLAELSQDERAQALDGLDPAALQWSWRFKARVDQLRATNSTSHIILFVAGRGAGKSRTGSEWVRDKIDHKPEGMKLRFALCSRTSADVRDTIIQGDALALDTVVPTPAGWTTMGELRPGDSVLAGDGTPCFVTEAFPVLVGRRCYRVRFRSGAEVVADGNHKWVTKTFNDRNYEWRHQTGTHGARVRTTEDIRATLRRGKGGWNHSIDLAASEFGNDEIDDKLPVDPYVLGLWLGDGHSRDGTFTFNDDEAPELLERVAAHYRVRPHARKKVPCAARDYGALGLKVDLRSIGVLNDKHIPVDYLRASRAARLDLLRGLMDTDGHASTNERLEFASSRLPLIQQVASLISSLGIKVALRRHGSGWRLQFQALERVFHLRAKVSRQRVRQPQQQAYDAIVAVDPVPSVPVRCIAVDHPSHTYMVTDRYRPTHNSGLMSAFPPHQKPAWIGHLRLLRFHDGSEGLAFSSREPDQLRGPQFHYGYADELAAWEWKRDDSGLTAWDNLTISTRLGENPQVFASTTPRRVQAIKDLYKRAENHDGVELITGASTYDNPYLSAAYLQTLIGLYEGTRLSAQELYGLLMGNVEGALWKLDKIENDRTDTRPMDLPLIVVGVDPSVAEQPRDECGIVVAAASGHKSFYRRHAYVLEDATVHGPPSKWAKEVVRVAHAYRAPVVAERNQGGALIKEVVQQLDPTLRIRTVHAHQGKALRAEPVTLAYDQRRVHHVGTFVQLEDQMTTWVPEDDNNSPDRLDALVYALSALIVPSSYKTGVGQARVKAARGRIDLGTKIAPRRASRVY